MASIHSGHRSRVKTEFLARGMDGWSDHRVLELLLFYAIPQGDVNGLAHTLIERFGSLSGVLDASTDELKKVPGVGEHTALLLRVIPAVAQRYVADRSSKGTIIQSVQEVIDLLRPYFFAARNEMVYILCLDAKNKLLGIRKLSEGSVDSASVNLRRMAEEALSLRAVNVYIAHNHISNLAFPSEEDWASTDLLTQVMRSVGVTIVDHIIFVDDDAVSLKQSGLRGRTNRYRII